MVPLALVITGWFDLMIGGFWLSQIIRKPPENQPPRAFIGRILTPVSTILFGASMIIQPIDAHTFILPLIASVFAFVGLALQIRYRPA